MTQGEIKIIGAKVEAIRYLNGLPVISFQLSSQPTRGWVSIFENHCKTHAQSKRPRITVVGDALEFSSAVDNEELQVILNILRNDVSQTNIQYEEIVQQIQQQKDSAKNQQDATLQKIKDNLGKLKY